MLKKKKNDFRDKFLMASEHTKIENIKFELHSYITKLNSQNEQKFNMSAKILKRQKEKFFLSESHQKLISTHPG